MSAIVTVCLLRTYQVCRRVAGTYLWTLPSILSLWSHVGIYLLFVSTICVTPFS